MRFGTVDAMPPLSIVPVFALASLALLLIPGPSVLYVVGRSGSQGRRAGLVSVLGVHTGTVFHVLAAAVGLSALVMASTVMFTAVKLLGGVYLITLGVRTLLRSSAIGLEPAISVRPLRRLYLDGLIVNLFNPKVALFFLAFLPQFIDRSNGPVWSQTLVLGLLYMALGLLSDGTYALVGARAGRWLNARPKRQRMTRRTEGALLIGLGITALLAPRSRVK